MGILLRGARMRIATALTVLGLGATGCGSDATPTPTEVPPSAAAPTATMPAAAPTATPLPAEPTMTAGATSVASINPLLAAGAFTVDDVVVDSGGVDLVSYQAVAEGGGSRPAVIVIHENRGLTPFIRDVVDGLASSGYLAIAPDLLSHEGGTAQAGDVPTVLRGVSMDRHVGDVDAVVRYLRSLPDVGEIGIIGFCFGGGVVWNVVTSNAGIAVAVPFYGSNPPLHRVPNITAAVRGIYGSLDSRINAGIPAITEALESAGIEHELEVYADAPHAFLNHDNAGRYVEAAAVDAWADTLAWLRAHLDA